MLFTISKEQIEYISNIILEALPGKHALPIIDIFRSLKKIADNTEQVKNGE